ncbi:MAG: hypothetical protein JWM11_2825 [Planctomycetaceae bacterium]|nr:hypothetical protein [Planctomycetaceae bacterium]
MNPPQSAHGLQPLTSAETWYWFNGSRECLLSATIRFHSPEVRNQRAAHAGKHSFEAFVRAAARIDFGLPVHNRGWPLILYLTEIVPNRRGKAHDSQALINTNNAG